MYFYRSTAPFYCVGVGKSISKGDLLFHTRRTTTNTKRLLELSTHSRCGQQVRAPTPELYNERLPHQSDIDNLSTKQTEQLLLKSKQTFYEHGEKAGKLLSHRQSTVTVAAPHLKSVLPADLTSTNPKEINNQFKQFYCALYLSRALPDTSHMHAFPDNLDIPHLNSDEQTHMDVSISDDEATRS